jgi:hypothetical protein
MLIPNLHFNRNDVDLTLEFHYGNFLIQSRGPKPSKMKRIQFSFF